MKTNLIFAEAIKECMKRNSLDDITVKQIAEKAKLSRQTFYRQFLDKYDLVNWYFDQLLFQSFKEMGESKSITEGLTKKLTFIQNESTFFNCAFQSQSQNSLIEHDTQQIIKFYENLIKKKSQMPIPNEINFSLEMYCIGSVHKTVLWLEKGQRETPRELAELLILALPHNIKDYFKTLDIQI